MLALIEFRHVVAGSGVAESLSWTWRRKMLDVRTAPRAFPRITTTGAAADEDDAVAYIITLVRRSVCSMDTCTEMYKLHRAQYNDILHVCKC